MFQGYIGHDPIGLKVSYMKKMCGTESWLTYFQ